MIKTERKHGGSVELTVYGADSETFGIEYVVDGPDVVARIRVTDAVVALHDGETGADIHRSEFTTEADARSYAADLAVRLDLDGMGVEL